MNKISSTDFWRLNHDMALITDELIDNCGELTTELVVRIESVNDRQEQIADAITSMSGKIDAENAAIDAEIKRLVGLKHAREKAVASLKRYLLGYMVSRDIKEIETPFCRVKVQQGRESINVDEDAECEAYMDAIEKMEFPSWVRVELSVKKKELKQWMEEGKPTKTAVIVRNPSLKFM